MKWSTIIQIVEGFMNMLQALLVAMKEHEKDMGDGTSGYDDTGAMRGKGDYDKLGGVEFAPPRRTRSKSPTTRPQYGGDLTGKNEADPEPYTWIDATYYPDGGAHG